MEKHPQRRHRPTSLQRAVIGEFYGIYQPASWARLRPLRTVGKILESALQAVDRDTDRLYLLRSLWRHIVGDALAAHCEPAKLVKNVLTISAANATVAQELSWRRAEILEAIQNLPNTAAVRKIVIITKIKK